MSDTRRLALELHEIRQLALGHATNPQFGNSSVDGEGLSFRDSNGNEIGRLGVGENGMEVEYTYGPKPLMPSTPIVTADANLLLVQWDGQWADGNEDGDAAADPDLASQAGLDRVEVHVSMEPTFVPDPVLSFAGVLPVTPEGGAHTVGPLAEAGDYYVVLMARGKDGQYSAPSQRVHVVTTVGLMENELFDLALRADEARESADGKNTVHYGEEPVAPEGGFSEGDLWFDTTEDPETGFRKNTPHLWDPSANDGEGGWVSAADSRVDAIRDAQDALREDVERIVTDGAGATTYWLPAEPGESTDPPPKEGDLWFNTAEGAETYLHRYTNGAWVGVDDARVGALEDAQEEFAQELTDAEQRALESAKDLADAAREAAEGRARAAQESADEAIARSLALRDAGSNLLLNGNFENASPDIWPNNSHQSDIAVIEVPDARSGTHVLEQGTPVANRYPLTDWLDTTEGRIYYVELWARRTDEASTSRIAFYRQVELTDKSTPGGYALHLDGGGAYYYGSDFPVGEWVKLSGYFTMPKDALRFRFGPHTLPVDPPYHFDDMRVIDVTEAVGALRQGAVTADAARDAAIEAAELKDQQVRTDIDAVIGGAVSDLEGEIATVRTSVDGKSRITQSVDAPPNQYDGAVGDRWERMSSMGSGGSLISNWRWNGTVWVSTLISDAVLGNVDAAKIGTGYLEAGRIKAGSITSDMIAVGLGGNLIPDPMFFDAEISAMREQGRWEHKTVDGRTFFEAVMPESGGNGDFNLTDAAGNLRYIPVAPGIQYSFELEVEGPVWIYLNVRYSDGTTSTPGVSIQRGGLGSERRVDRFVIDPGDYPHATAGVVSNLSVAIRQPGIIQVPVGTVTRVFAARFSPMVGTTLIEPGAVTTDQIAAKAITAGKIDAGAVEAEHIVAGGIEADSLIVAGSLGETLIADGAISTRTVQADAIGAEAIAAGVIEGEHVKAGSLTADKLLVGGVYNLLPNGDLSAGNTAMWPNDAVYATEDPPPGHDRYVDWGVTTSTASLSTFGSFPVTVGDEIVVELWIKADKPGSVVFFEARTQGGSSISLGQATNWVAETFTNRSGNYPVGSVAVPDVWTLWRSRLKISNPDTIDVYLASFYRNHSNGDIRDARLFTSGIRLFKRVGATLIEGGAITTHHIESGSITAESGIIASLDAGKITVGELDGARIKAKSVQADSVIVNGSVGTTLIDGGAITTEKIAVGAITAESGIIGSLDAGVITTGELRGELIRAQSIAGESLAVDAIDGKTITGATVRTSSAGARVEMNSTGLFVKNSVGANTVSMTNGVLTMLGGTITGGTIRTHTSGARVQLDTGGLKAWNPSNEETFSVDANTGMVESRGALYTGAPGTVRAVLAPGVFDSVSITDPDDGSTATATGAGLLLGDDPARGSQIFHAKSTVFGKEFDSLTILGPSGATSARQAITFARGMIDTTAVAAGGNLWSQIRTQNHTSYMFTQSSGVSTQIGASQARAYMYANTGSTRVASILVGNANARPENAIEIKANGGISLESVTDLSIHARGRKALDLRSDSTSAFFQSDTIYHRTYSAAANLYITGSQVVGRTTSARRYKLDEAVVEASEFEDALLSIPFKSWVDKEQKRLHDDLVEFRAENPMCPPPEHLQEAPDELPRHIGAVAEDFVDAGLDSFVTYDQYKRVDGLQYDRIGPALIPVVRRLRDRVNELERMMGEMANA